MARHKQWSLKEDSRRDTTRVYRYESFWGTPNTKNSKRTTSVQLAKHPLLAWAQALQFQLAHAGYTDEERLACDKMIESINNIGNFEGQQTWNLEAGGMKFQAIMLRLPKT